MFLKRQDFSDTIGWLGEDFGGFIGGEKGILRLKLTVSLPLRHEPLARNYI